ncbi:hypothetical protein ABMA46_10215 [Mesorhizobium sp. CN5-321]|uniref:hypothetical protein n=1 Tax=Mesorhizobium hunchu TaxID=3157708 RepID=UPI0032B7B9CA
MDNWLKGLVAAACIVIIAGGGFLAWSKWVVYQAELARVAAAKAEIEAQRANEIAAAERQAQKEKCADTVFEFGQKVRGMHVDEATIPDEAKKADQCLLDFPEIATSSRITGLGTFWAQARLDKLQVSE